MCGAGKNGKIGAEIAAVVFSLLTAFISIGAMAGSFYKLNIKALDSCSAGSVEFFPLYSLTVLDGQTTKANYADECKFQSSPYSAFCALQKNAANNGSAAVGMYVVALFLSLASAVFIALRVVRQRNTLLAASSAPGSFHPAPKQCFTRAAGAVTFSVFSFILTLIASITVWVGVGPMSLWFTLNNIFSCVVRVGSVTTDTARPLSIESGAGAACAGIVIATSFFAMVLDASSHCCCKSPKELSAASTVVVVSPVQGLQGYATPHGAAMPPAPYGTPQPGFGAPYGAYAAPPAQTTVVYAH